MLQPYTRPVLTQEDFKEARLLASQLNKLSVRPAMLYEAFEKLILENIRLAKECNEHRAARGLEPLPITKV